MALVEALLVYKPAGLGGDVLPTSVAKTSDPHLLRLLRDKVLREAVKEARTWEGIDPGLAMMRRAEVDRLTRILAVLIPDEDPEPGLKLVKK